MTTEYDKAKPGGNSSFGNPNRPSDIQDEDGPKTPPPGTRPNPAPASKDMTKSGGGSAPAGSHAEPIGKTAAIKTGAMVQGSVGSGDLHRAPS